jgi:peptide deformylase
MVQPLLIYPDDRINCTSTDVRLFNQTLWDIIEDMRDTMIEHNLEALSAIQIAYPYNIILIKDGSNYLELINPRMLTQSGKFDSIESTSYYPNVTVTIKRDENIKLVYEDRDGKVHHKDISDKNLSATIQRKIDYTFGGNLLDKVSKARREEIIDALAKDGIVPLQADDVCPTFSKKDYFISFSDKILFFMGLSLLSPLFNFSKETMGSIYSFDKIGFITVIILLISFFFYAQYEAKKYKQCSSCQIGNNIGVMVKRGVVAIVVTISAYFIYN